MPLFFLLILLPALWLSWKIWRTGLPLPLRILLCAVTIAVSQIYTLHRFILHSISGPDIPPRLMEAQIWALAALVIAFLLSVALDIVLLLIRLFRRLRERVAGASAEPSDPSRRSFLAGASTAGLAVFTPVACATSAIGVSNALQVPEIRPWEVLLPGLPSDLDGFRIIHFADLHVGPLTEKSGLEELVRRVNSAGADVICVSGDLSDGLPSWSCVDGVTREEAARTLSGLSARHGVYACTGNHEYYSDYEAWAKVWEETGVRFLHNTSVALARGDATLLLGGLDDPVSGSAEDLNPFPEEFDGNTFRVLMDHRPTRAAGNVSTGAGLQLSGHTHGGQCPGLDLVVARANNGFVRGWYQVAGMPMYVTTGASQWSGFATRLGVPPEIALLTLRRSLDNTFRAVAHS